MTHSPLSLLPRPSELELLPGQGRAGASSRVLLRGGADAQVASRLAALLSGNGTPAPVVSDTPRPGDVLLQGTEPDEALGEEGYRLQVQPDLVRIEAPRAVGLFYGVQTLRQLLPPQQAADPGRDWPLPCLRIQDRPRFGWRGMHLDVARHFFDVDFVKRYIDLIALHRMNRFHWHLTDDQGWRVEVPEFPRLTQVGAWRDESPRPGRPWQGDGQPHGGAYSQDEIREVVAYAAERFVQVVPEIELPGHAQAALAAYPHLSCNGRVHRVRTRWGISKELFCLGNDQTLAFVDQVLDSLLPLFPGEFVHLGGDECPQARWRSCPRCQARMRAQGLKNERQLHRWFLQRMAGFLAERGRRLVGWDEILTPGLPRQAVVMAWRGTGRGLSAARAGHDVVLCPTSHCYFDYYQSLRFLREPPAFPKLLPLWRVYAFEPVPKRLSAQRRQRILGLQGNLWTEFVPTPAQAEYMALPRMAALAEVAWAPRGQRSWKDFRARLPGHLARLQALGYRYRALDR